MASLIVTIARLLCQPENQHFQQPLGLIEGGLDLVVRFQHQIGGFLAEGGRKPSCRLHGFPGRIIRNAAEFLQIVGGFSIVQQGSCGADAAEMAAYRAQNCQRFLLHFQQLLQFLKGLVVASGAEQVGHLKYHRVQHRFRDGVDVAFANFIRAGIGADFVNFAAEGRHGAAGDVDEVGAKVGGNPFPCRREMPGHPGDQVPLVLLGKFHDAAVALHCFPEFFQPLVRLPGGGEIGKDHSAVVRDILKNVDHFLPVGFVHLEGVHIVHLDEGIFRHHGKILHRVRKGLQIESLLIQAVVIEGFCQGVQKLLFDLL